MPPRPIQASKAFSTNRMRSVDLPELIAPTLDCLRNSELPEIDLSGVIREADEEADA